MDRNQTTSAREAWAKARRRGDEEGTARLLRDLQRAAKREAEERTRAFGEHRRRRAEISDRAGLRSNRTLLGTAYFWLE